jgi:transcriptional regulator with XRE-family HTH domain
MSIVDLDRFKSIVKAQGLTLRKACEIMDINETTLTRTIKEGYIKAGQLYTLAKAIDVSMESFFEDATNEEFKPNSIPTAQINGGVQNTINQVQSMEDCRKQLEGAQRELALYQDLLKTKEQLIKHITSDGK